MQNNNTEVAEVETLHSPKMTECRGKTQRMERRVLEASEHLIGHVLPDPGLGGGTERFVSVFW
jgi:hypothetical protein